MIVSAAGPSSGRLLLTSLSSLQARDAATAKTNNGTSSAPKTNGASGQAKTNASSGQAKTNVSSSQAKTNGTAHAAVKQTVKAQTNGTHAAPKHTTKAQSEQWDLTPPSDPGSHFLPRCHRPHACQGQAAGARSCPQGERLPGQAPARRAHGRGAGGP